MKINSLKFVHCNIDSGNELPRSLRSGPYLWINMDSTILISYSLPIFTSLKFSSCKHVDEYYYWGGGGGGMLNDCSAARDTFMLKFFYIWVVSLLCRKMSTDHIDIYKYKGILYLKGNNLSRVLELD